MNYADVLKVCQARGINIGMVEGKLKVLDPHKRLDNDLLAAIRQNKAQLTRVLSAGRRFTLSDFPHANMDQTLFDQCQRQYPDFSKLYIATPMQSGLLFHGLLDGTGASYTSQSYFDLVGEVDVALLQQAWQHIVNRHDILRTCFVGMDSEQIHQLVQNKVTVPFSVQDWTDISEKEQQNRLASLRSSDKAKGVDFAKAPLMRITLIRLEADRYHFLWSHHHVLLDGWCIPVIFDEVISTYQRLLNKLPVNLPEPVAYESYIGWLMAQKQDSAEAFWQQHLAGITAPTPLVVDKLPVNSGLSSHIKLSVDLPQNLSNKLEQLAKSSQTTLNVVVQTAWAYLLHRYSGVGDVVFGATVSGRPAQLPGVEQIMGLFINTIPVRVGFDDKTSLHALLQAVHKDNQSRNDFSYLALSDIQRLSEISTPDALFDTLLVFENQPQNVEDSQQSGQSLGFSVEGAGADERTNYKLLLTARNTHTGLNWDIHFSQAEFAKETIERLNEHLLLIFTLMAESDADKALPHQSLLTGQQAEQLANWNQTEFEFDRELCVHQWFEGQVVERPEQTAIIFEQHSLTYQALNQRANQLANYLVEQGVKPDTLVGLCCERSLEMVIGMLAICKAGGGYLPLDPTLPQSRLEYMLSDAKVGFVVTQERWLKVMQEMPGTDTQTWLALDTQQTRDTLAQYHDGNITVESIGLTSEHLAYVIYTSGSTGQPKGVCLEHRALINRINWMQHSYCLTEQDKVLQKTPFTFDVSVWEFFWPLAFGAQMVLAKPQGHKDPQYLADIIQSQNITTLHYVPSMLNMMLLAQDWAKCTSVRQVFCSGEALSHDLVKKFYQTGTNAQLHNLYGPTEAAIDVSFWDCKAHVDTNLIPIGQPIHNIQLLNLDAELNPLPIGLAGELHIGGVGLARGYLNKPELSEKQFIANPFSDEPGSRLYKTGDLVRWLDNGDIDYLGRIDNQVKVRGFRIELGEIEEQLLAVEGVVHSCVLAREDNGSDKRLVGYVVDELQNDSNSQARIDVYRQQLAQFLPEYMVPSIFVQLEQMPLSPNGKLDRKALPAPKSQNLQTADYVAPRNEIESQLCEIWQEALKVEQVGIEDNFFSLGGDSIISIQVVSRARAKDLHFSVKQLFEAPCVAQLAEVVDANNQIDAPQHMIEGELQLLPIQNDFFAQQLAVPSHNNQAMFLTVPDGFNQLALEQLVEALYLRHDALRLRFDHKDGQAKATFASFIDSMIADTVDYHDLSALDKAQADDKTLKIAEQTQSSLNITDGTLFKAVYFNRADESSLLLVIHHLVVDGVSWRILLSDLELGWQQLSQGQRLELPAKTSSLQQWGEALAEYSTDEALTSEQAYWVEQLSIAVEPLPRKSAVVDNQEQVIRLSITAEQTEQLLGQCGEPYGTRINELLLAALLRAYQQWTQGESLSLTMEGHGREALFDHLDTSETVGWFTSVYPLTLGVDRSADMGTFIKEVKEQYRAIPNNGIGFGLLRYLKKDEAINSLAAQSDSESIEFNYLGQLDNSLSQESAFNRLNASMGELSSPLNEMPVRMSINGAVHMGQMGFEIAADAQIDNVAGLAELFKKALEDCISHCLTATKCYTPSDFVSADMDMDTLAQLQQDYPNMSNLYIATPMQNGFLFHGKIDGGESYTSQICCDLNGQVNPEVMAKAWQMVVDRHDVLRTSFIEGVDDSVHQLVEAKAVLPFDYLDWRGQSSDAQAQLAQLRHDDKAKGFDFAHGPMTRVTLVQLSEDSWHFIWSVHHVLLDGWCTPIIFSEVLSAYRALIDGQIPQLPPVVPYVRYIDWLYQQDERKAKAFWQAQLAEFQQPTPLALGEAPSKNDGEPTSIVKQTLTLNPQLSDQLSQLVQQNHCTYNVLLQLAWSYLLHRYSNQADVVFGSTISGRPAHLPGIERMMGLFINTIPVRVNFNEDLTVAQMLAQLHKDNVSRDEFGYLSLSEIQSLSSVPNGTSIFDSLLIFENTPAAQALNQSQGKQGVATSGEQPLGFSIGRVDLDEYTNYPLTLIGRIEGGQLSIELTYRTDALSESMVEGMCGHLRQIFSDMAAGGSAQPVRQLNLLDETQIADMLAPLPQLEEQSNTSVAARFAQQVEDIPHSIALVSDGQSYSFAQINEQSNRLAHYLQSQGVGIDSNVGLCVERGLMMIVGVLAVIKAGGAYVPLDTEYPLERLQFILEDGGIKILLSQSDLMHNAKDQLPNEVEVVMLDWDSHLWSECSTVNPEVAGSLLDAPAYIMYASGSEGKPKGVVVSHQNLLSYYQGASARYGIDTNDRILQFSATSLDIFVEEVFLSLLNGAALVLRNDEMAVNIDQFWQFVTSNEISVLSLPTAFWHMLTTELPEQSLIDALALRLLIVGGEKMSYKALRKWQTTMPSSVRLLHTYGPTETTVAASSFDATDYVSDSEEVPVGEALEHVRLYILDNNRRLVPKGAVGELYIGGSAVAKGYLNRDAVTKACFIDHHFSENDGTQSQRLYKSGDLVRLDSDGQLCYVGRADGQVKIRGFRIELGEIEHRLSANEAIESAVVMARQDGAAGDSAPLTRLVGYVRLEASSPEALDLSANPGEMALHLRQVLRQHLPDYMVPTLYVLVDKWPLTKNGKVDKKALPAPDLSTMVDDYQLPSGDFEPKMAEIWAHLLNIDVQSISARANFFELGGHSLLLIRLIAQIRQRFEVEMTVEQVMDHLELQQLSQQVYQLKLQQSISVDDDYEAGSDEIEFTI